MKIGTFSTKLPLMIVALAFAMSTAKVQGQGTVYLNNYDSNAGIFSRLNPPFPLAAPDGTMAEVLGGASPESLVPLVNSAGVGPAFPAVAGLNEALPGDGSFFDAGYGSLTGVPSTGTGWFQVLAWFGAPTFEAAPLRGQSPVWSQSLDANQGGHGGHAILKIPGPILLVPEPATAALAAIGFAAMLAFRRRVRRANLPESLRRAHDVRNRRTEMQTLQKVNL